LKRSKIIRLADLFCGAGGSLTGSVEALEEMGFDVHLWALNHWATALATSHANHPKAKHLRADLDSFNPRSLFARGELDFLWASPECTYHSNAAGIRPVNEQSRSTAFSVVHWFETLMPRLGAMVENVPEFEDWGECDDDGRRIKSKAGRIFQAWKAMFRAMGASIDEKVFCAADYGDPTLRRRLMVQIQPRRRKIVWPEPTHGAPDSIGVRSGKLKAWVPAWKCIDFRVPCHSIFLSKAAVKRMGLRIKRPLVEASHRRIAKGTLRYVMEADEPFIVCLTHAGGDRVESIEEPFRTTTCAHRGERALVMPFVSYAQQGGRSRDITDPMHTICASAKDQNQVIAAFVGRQYGTSVGHAPDEPLRAVVTDGAGAKNQVVSAFLAQNNGGFYDGDGLSIERPMSTICGRGTNQSLIVVSLLKYYGADQDPQIGEPLPTCTSKDRFGVQESCVAIPPLTGERIAMARRVAAFLREHGIVFEGEFARTKSGLIIYDLGMRMFEVPELALAQGFRPDYVFKGTKTAQVKQIGNAVPRRLAKALVAAAVSQRSNVEAVMREAA
jgi:DNA (cytosine-5)-methyltransferase 1